MNKTNIDYSYHNMILGKPGTGKTHLIYSEIKRILLEDPNSEIIILSDGVEYKELFHNMTTSSNMKRLSLFYDKNRDDSVVYFAALNYINLRMEENLKLSNRKNIYLFIDEIDFALKSQDFIIKLSEIAKKARMHGAHLTSIFSDLVPRDSQYLYELQRTLLVNSNLILFPVGQSTYDSIMGFYYNTKKMISYNKESQRYIIGNNDFICKALYFTIKDNKVWPLVDVIKIGNSQETINSQDLRIIIDASTRLTDDILKNYKTFRDPFHELPERVLLKALVSFNIINELRENKNLNIEKEIFEMNEAHKYTNDVFYKERILYSSIFLLVNMRKDKNKINIDILEKFRKLKPTQQDNYPLAMLNIFDLLPTKIKKKCVDNLLAYLSSYKF